jgi:hypothetical protein
MCFDKLDRLTKEDIGAVARELLGPAVVIVGVVEIAVSPIIRNLADAAAAVDENLLKAAILRPEWAVVAEVPLAEDGRRVAVVGMCRPITVCQTPTRVE